MNKEIHFDCFFIQISTTQERKTFFHVMEKNLPFVVVCSTKSLSLAYLLLDSLLFVPFLFHSLSLSIA